MDNNFETVPFQYLRADRHLFLNTEFLLQLDDVDNPDTKPGRHWYVDAVAYEPASSTVFLSEFSYSIDLAALRNRLKAWSEHWSLIESAIERDTGISGAVSRPWAFVPEQSVGRLVKAAEALGFHGRDQLPVVKITTLEMTLPWKYRQWKRLDEQPKPPSIPKLMI